MPNARMYRVRISEIEAADESWLGSKYADSVRVASVTVIARRAREAAARAYVRVLGRQRMAVLVQLGAPAFIIRAERSVRRLARGLEKTADWAGPCYRLDNMVQQWHFHVRRRALSRVERVRLAAFNARRANRNRQSFRRIGAPSVN